MTISSPVTTGLTVGKMVKLIFYSFFVLGLQAYLVERLPYPALRVDLLLPVMFTIGVECSPLAGVLWAALLGFVVDNFSGEFWGMHVGSFTITVCLVNMASEKFDWCNPAYQMGLIGLCAFAQSLAIGLFLCFVPMEVPAQTSIWISLGIRALLSATIAPFIIYPILNSRKTLNG